MHTIERNGDGGGEHQQYLTFRLGQETFAMPILSIKEILEYPTLTNVPLMAACVRGVLNLRGSVVPVVDLAVRFGREPGQQTRRTCVVIIEVQADGEWMDVGVVVDGGFVVILDCGQVLSVHEIAELGVANTRAA